MTKAETTTRYELPEGGTHLLAYIVRRMHKTVLLEEAVARLEAGSPAEALLAIGLYSAAASSSFGDAHYQPGFNRVGDHAFEVDPATGALVEARLIGADPRYVIEQTVRLPGGSVFSARETIEGTTIGLRGLRMPAPTLFEFSSPRGDYTAHIAGTITSELAPGVLRPTRIRAYGDLSLGDSAGNTGRLTLARDGQARIEVSSNGRIWQRELDLAGAVWPALTLHIDEVQAGRGGGT